MDLFAGFAFIVTVILKDNTISQNSSLAEELESSQSHPFSHLLRGNNAVLLFVKQVAASFVHQLKSALCSLSGREEHMTDPLRADEFTPADVVFRCFRNDALSIRGQRDVRAASLF